MRFIVGAYEISGSLNSEHIPNYSWLKKREVGENNDEIYLATNLRAVNWKRSSSKWSWLGAYPLLPLIPMVILRDGSLPLPSLKRLLISATWIPNRKPRSRMPHK